MPKVTDALFVLDPTKILTDHGTNDGYKPLNNEGLGYVFAVAPFSDVAQSTDQSEVDAQQAQDHQQEEGGDQAELIINVGDVARFRSLPLGWRSDHQCFIDKIVFDTPGNKIITSPTKICRSVSSTELDPTATLFTQYTLASEVDHYHEATTLCSGTAKFTVNFSIYDDKLRRLGGYSLRSQIKVEA